ncbi:hypothetical protein L198_01412 [Cryptococcus wingfieldii CBS 7118]|uniref:N-acetyltransferase ESCO acetyl-transferase domain-containing protein n=1 Tax=Cryptococcus wingfieldii CBS 7118 TaxID=1295528 RepID=A0A1E3JZ98_9TREE|nr:hypothetical protein L198_01412 [Cryptococcus wingfieldii CBS 7118]ODO06180.1 hypothetical protein L198_01412 [Cryptococcus wingfieldii CBS 7118]
MSSRCVPPHPSPSLKLTIPRPVVRKTYGKAPPRSSSTVSLFDASPPPTPSLAGPSSSAYRSSSPSFDRLDSPLGSSPPRAVRERDGTPLFFSCDEEEEETRQSRDGLVKEQSVKAKAKAPVKVVKKAETQSSLKGFFAPLPKPKKRPLEPSPANSSPSPSSNSPSSMLGLSRPATITKFIKTPTPTPSAPGKENKSTTRKPVQMRLTHLPLLHTCPQCGMSFMRGGEDEAVHRVHHTRVLRGIVWEGVKVKGKGREEGWRVVADDVEFGEGKGKGRGRVVVVDGSVGGPKINEILSTVDLVLSAPALPPPILAQCKIFLFLTSSPPPPPSESTAKRQKLDPTLRQANKDGRERVISVVVAQGIKWAMRVLKDGEGVDKKVVETGGFGSVSCEPTHLPTPLGIHRLYTIPSYRSHHLSTHLLNAACAHTVYGCELDPKKGQVAFSQPTESGRKMMERWGGGEVRVFVDDESQL